MVNLLETKIDNRREKRILAGMITSTNFLAQVLSIYKSKYFESRNSRLIAKWCKEYFEKYGKAPNSVIVDILDDEAEKMTVEQAELVDAYLQSLSGEFAEEEVNTEFYLNSAREYFEERAIANFLKSVEGALATDGVEKAKDLLFNYGREEVTDLWDWINPDDEDEWKNLEERKKQRRLLKFRGKLGEYLGWLEREWFVSFTAPEKRGKTWWLIECIFQAMQNKCKVLFFSLEMNHEEVKERYYQRLTGTRLPDTENPVIFSVFDCRKNQLNECEKSQRACRTSYYVGSSEAIIEYDPNEEQKYKPCTFCRDHENKEVRKDYEVATWFSHTSADEYGSEVVGRKIKAKNLISKGNKDLLRVKSFPSFSAGYKEITRKLREIEARENFVPDVIIVDYVDILASEGNLLGREAIDAVWKNFKRLASERKCLVITADQSNKISMSRESVRIQDTSEDKRKNAHVNLKVAINQTLEEKEQMVTRIGKIAQRHGNFHPYRQVIACNCLDLGQIMTDAEYCYVEERRK